MLNKYQRSQKTVWLFTFAALAVILGQIGTAYILVTRMRYQNVGGTLGF